MNDHHDAVAAEESDQVFDSAAELFRLLSTPIRLKIISALCGQEKNVSQLLDEIATTQPNMSQHLATLYRAGVLARRLNSEVPGGRSLVMNTYRLLHPDEEDAAVEGEQRKLAIEVMVRRVHGARFLTL